MKTLAFTSLVALLAYIGICVAVFMGQRKLMYFPSQEDAKGLGDGDFTPWLSETNDFLGYVRVGVNSKRVILLFHGNAGIALDRKWIAQVVPKDEAVLILFLPVLVWCL